MADFEIAIIVYVEIYLFDLVVKFILLFFDFFFLFELFFCSPDFEILFVNFFFIFLF